ncbi:MAG: hypothetical protein A2Y33_11505 [Spirochaetes bacterium GWF1_51_8]|nr:MAG: hypothetical protein A2Y33_11505 [Spirochaetes bacterium GWF1_51_8]
MKRVSRMGFWSSVFTAAMVFLFLVALIISIFNPGLDYLCYIPCAVLPWSFTLMLISLHYSVPEKKRVFTLAGVISGAVYIVLCTAVYYIQLSVIQNNSLMLSNEILTPFVYTPGTPAFALDMLGYVFLCLGVLASSQVFGKDPLEKWLRRAMVINGLFAVPTFIYPLIPMPNTAGASGDMFGSIALIFWCLIFIPVPVMLARYFRQLKP